MYIRRKVFSILTDEVGEERLYSVNETLFEDCEEREFAESEEKEKVALKDINSKRGIGRGGVFTGIVPLYVSRKVSKRAANKADEEGASDVVIVEKAKSAGTKAGAATGAALGAISGGYAVKNAKDALKNVSRDLGGKNNRLLSVGERKLLVGARKALKNKKVVGGIVAAGALNAALGGAIGGRLSADKMTRSRLVKRHNLEQEKKNKKEDK